MEALLESARDLIGRYVLVQIAAPTRQGIPRYRKLLEDLEAEVGRVNGRFGQGTWSPIILQARSAPPEEIRRVYAMADSAVVTPVHDGMNLVAKEYVASCADGRGALVLSRFTGAAIELSDALLVNPYDEREVAAAILEAIRMAPAERFRRMRAMRQAVVRNTIDDWAARLLADVAEARGALGRDVVSEALALARDV